MQSKLMRWTAGAGLACLFLLLLLLLPHGNSASVVQAAEPSDLLDINSATADQLKTLIAKAGGNAAVLIQRGKNRLFVPVELG